MASEQNLLEEDESADEDYAPSDEPGDDEEDPEVGSNDDQESGDDEVSFKGKKRTGRKRRGSKKLKGEQVTEENNDSDNMLTEAELKAKADALWAELNAPPVAPKVANSETKAEVKIIKSTPLAVSKEPQVIVEKEKVEEIKGKDTELEKASSSGSKGGGPAAGSSGSSLQKQPPAKPRGLGGGLGSLVAGLGKQQKVNVLSKTKLDWETFKSDEGIEEDLTKHTKSKDSFVERQAFLQRADLRQFEIEKNIRAKNRTRQLP